MWFRLQMLPEPVMVLLQERICSLRGANSFPITEPSHITGIRYSPIAEVKKKKMPNSIITVTYLMIRE